MNPGTAPVASPRRFLAATLLLAMLFPLLGTPGAPAAERRRPVLAESRALATGDDNIPGVMIGPSPVRGTLDQKYDTDDVYKIWLYQGQQLTLQVTGSAGTTFDINLYQPKDTDVFTNPPIAFTNAAPYPQTLRYTVPIGISGWYYIDLYASYGVGSYSLSYSYTDPAVAGPIKRVSGPDRYRTAIAISKSAFATSSVAVIATGLNYADALAASGLCGSYGAPLLLVDPSSADSAANQAVLSEIVRLGATNVIAVGGENVVSDDVLRALTAGRARERIGGINRFDTARKIAERIKAHETAQGRAFTNAAFFVNGYSFADALSVSPYAYSQRMPVLLTLNDEVPQATADATASLGTTEGYVVGGPSVVSTGALEDLGMASATRLAGATRYGTCLAVTNWATGSGRGGWNYVGVATGMNFPDALGGGVAAGRQGGVLLLTMPDRLSTEPWRALQTHKATVMAGAVRAYGGPGVLSPMILGDLDAALR